MEKKKIIVSNHQAHMKVMRDINNKKKYNNIVDRGKLTFAELSAGVERARFEVLNADNTAWIEANTEDELKKIMKALSETGRKGFLYIVGQAIERGYTSDEFEININELLGVLELKRKTDSVNRLIDYLRILMSIKFTYPINTDKKEKPRFGESYLITDIQRVESGRKIVAISIRLGLWIEDLKNARKENRAMLLTLPLECLKVDTKHYPYSFGVPYYMASYARTNAKKKTEWHTLTLQEAIKGTEPWEEAEKAIKKRGFNNDRAFIERLTQSLEHAEPFFKYQWQWKDKEPETIEEARDAKIQFKFLEPLKKEAVSE